MNIIKISLLTLLFLASCTGKKSESKSKSGNISDDVKFEQYLVEGQQLYSVHCAACHQTNGEGLGKLYPPLAKSSYLMENLNRAICVIKNGQKGSIVVNGVEYNQPMPAVTALTPLEIAEVMTYIRNSWGNKSRLITTEEVKAALEGCQ